MRHRNPLVFLAVFFLGIIAAISAQQTSASISQRGLGVAAKELGNNVLIGRQYLVLVGIDRYSHQAWPPLRNPVKDCRELKAILTSRYVIDETIELYDAKATSAGFYALLEDLQKRLEPNDSLLFYYAGHGNLSTVTDVGYIIPADGGATPGQGWVSDAELRGWLRKVESRHVCLMLDSCFSGAILDDRRSMRPTIDSEYFRNAYARQSRQVLTSGASETVPDDSEFAYQLKAELKANNKSILDPLMIYNNIRLGMKRTQPLFGNVRDSGAQEGGSFLLFLKDANSAGESAGGETREDARVIRAQKTQLMKLDLKPDETVRDIIANPTGIGYVVVTAHPKSILRKSYDYYITQGTKRLGPYSRVSSQEHGAWIAESLDGQWYVGSSTSVTGPLSKDNPPGWARSLEDRRLAFKVDISEGGAYLQEGLLKAGTFDYIWAVTPSPSNTSVAYIGSKDGKSYVIVGDKSFGPFDGAGSIIWSPDGSTYAFQAYIANQNYIFVNGEKNGPYKMLSSFIFAPDGKTLVYGADNYLVAGDERLGPYKGTPGSIVFAPSGGHFAFSVWEKNEGNIVYLDSGETYGPFPWGSEYTFSPDGKSFFCSGYEKEADSRVVYLDGKRIVLGNRYATTLPLFSAEGRHKAFSVDIDWGEWKMYLGSEKIEIDGGLPYGLLSDGSPLYWVTRGETHTLMIGNTDEGSYSAVADVSDASSFRFLASQDDRLYLITCPR